MSGLSVQNIAKSYAAKAVLKSVSFFAPAEKITAILGPSGCGKSTLLHIIAGLEPTDAGDVFWNGQRYTDKPAHQRGFGLMFQENALFPHLNVAQNIAFGLRMVKTPPDLIHQKVSDMLALVNLAGFEKRDVHTLSGGEAQRVALARTLAPQPCMLMLDEPMGSLDRTLRDLLVIELRSILRDLQLTTLYVTHDQEEAFSLADQVIIMNAGLIEQVGTPEAIYHSPANVFVAKFLGLTNLFPAVGEGSYAETAIGRLPLPFQAQGKFTLLVRPEAMQTDKNGSHSLEGKVIERIFLGSVCRATIEIQGHLLHFNFPPHACVPNENQVIILSFVPQEAIQILPESDLNLDQKEHDIYNKISINSKEATS